LPSNPTTIFDELAAAARGTAALVVGDRRAAHYFDFGPRGLAGSFIAFLTATLFNAFLPILLGVKQTSGSMAQGLVMVGLLYVLQVGCSALVLRQLKRLDGLVPYIVADNWATFFITILSAIIATFGIGADFALLAIGILVIVVEINIARLIVTLSPMQIAMFLIAQLVGVSIGLIVIGMIMPLPPGVNPAL
jgi:hypothetical protein